MTRRRRPYLCACGALFAAAFLAAGADEVVGSWAQRARLSGVEFYRFFSP